MTNIEWTDRTWNSIVGCSRISAGCRNCYAADAAKSARLQQFPQYQEVKEWNGKTTFVESQLLKPLSWKQPQKIFTCSMSDLFHENNQFNWIDQILGIMALSERHTFQVLTKRLHQMLMYFDYQQEFVNWVQFNQLRCAINLRRKMPLSNVWFGVSVENQEAANERIPLLREAPAALRFLSCEPLLEEVKLDLTGIDWVIVGGESGDKARVCHIDWIRSIVHQCKAAGVPMFVKQLGRRSIASNLYIDGVASTYYHFKTKDRKGGNMEEFPEDLKIREFPQ
ncbi:phage Gp37/Gp68 family protein [Microcoleus sp. FACHB-672]|uniref:phage Gp37/Gp68 family protein n=1 Tax=Microcoleus sp. FACHB-672 TaxID=2692825 RepID=UPI001686E683|nr:phage Gp37/Gp68 family protein [Microcoleus sp. FACHB-672]MBD2039242.1 phage Gp37/Gp68 family protein [Microcoleus sp. FACHB-672]